MIRAEHTVIWPTIPLKARVVKARCRKVEDVVVMRRAGIAVRDLSDCPVAARLLVAHGSKSETIPYGPDIGASFLLHDGVDYWRPMEGHRGRPTFVDSFPEMIVRVQDHGLWNDWCLAVPRRELTDGKLPVHREEDLIPRRWESDLNLEQAKFAETWRDDVGVRDGMLYRRCIEEPRIEVRADGLIHESFRTIRILPRAIASPEEAVRGQDGVLQVFRPDRFEEACAYAHRISLAVHRSQVLTLWRWDFEPGVALPFSRPEDVPTLAIASGRRFVARTEAIVGKLDRTNAIRWLDLRESVMRDALDLDAAWGVFMTMHALHAGCAGKDPRTARTIRFHSALELVRIEDNGKPRQEEPAQPELSEDDLDALEGIA